MSNGGREPVQVQVHREGKTFTQTYWMRSADAEKFRKEREVKLEERKQGWKEIVAEVER